MAKVTSKYQVTVPKTIADAYHIHPGDDIEWVPAGEVIRVVPANKKQESRDTESRLRMFDQATARHKKRAPSIPVRSGNRGWKREDLYLRGRSH